MKGIGGVGALIACASLFAVLPSVGQAQVQWSGNGHMYELVTTPKTWNDAKLDAENRTFLGVSGHLLTITSQAEQDFIINVFGEPLREKWTGGFEIQGVWQWVTGESFGYTNWAPGEPNNNTGVINFFGAATLGTWNDITPNISLGYFVEYDTTTLIAWPMEGQDRYGTDRAVTGPDPGELMRPRIETLLGPAGGVSHGPSLGFDGIGYFGSWSGNLLCKWNYNTGEALGSFDALNFIQCTPAIGPNGTVFITTVQDSGSTRPGRVFAIDPNTMDWIWSFVTGYVKVNDWESCSPNIGPDGDVVVGSTIGRVWRLNGATGAVVWQAPVGECRYTIPFSRDDTMVYASNGTAMTALNYADGSVAWSVNFASRLGAPGVASDGTIVVGSVFGTVYGLDPTDGSTRWTFTALDQVLTAPGFSADGIAYVTSLDHRLYALRVSDGVRMWSYTTSVEICTAPSVGHDGRIYVGNITGDLYSILPSGECIWQVHVCNEVRGPLSVGPDGSVYVGFTGDPGEPGGLLIVHQDEELKILPDSFWLFRGVLADGGLGHLFDSDDCWMTVLPGITLNQSERQVQLIVVGTASTETPSELRFRVEAHAEINNIGQWIELWNYDTNSYEQVDFMIATTVDSIVEIIITVDPQRFIEPGTMEMKAKVSYKEAGIVLQFPWLISFDMTAWVIVP